jgi:hypothetical protein
VPRHAQFSTNLTLVCNGDHEKRVALRPADSTRFHLCLELAPVFVTCSSALIVSLGSGRTV